MILPAAGFGRRVGSPEAKEMLMVRGLRGQREPMIAYALRVARRHHLATHVIVRKEKKSLIEYLKQCSRNQEISWQIVRPTKEWPDTVLASEKFWRRKNIVCLPDTRFRPQKIVQKMNVELDRHAVVWSVFRARDLRSWGVVDAAAKQHAEKPQAWHSTARPWGLFGFQKAYGRRVLSSLLASTLAEGDAKWRELRFRQKVCGLEGFWDLAR